MSNGVGYSNNHVIGFSLFIILLLISPQFAHASWLDDLENAFKGTVEKIKDALEKGEEITYEIAKDYFEREDYRFEAENLSIEKKLLSIIFDSNQKKYSQILYKIIPIQQYEVALQKYLIYEILESIKTEDTGWNEYRSDIEMLLDEFLTRQMIATFSNQKEIDALNQNRGLVSEATCFVFKAIPVYDSKENKPMTLDEAATNLVDKVPALKESDVGKDPIRFSCILLVDSDYLLYAKIIKTPDEKWISIEEASALGYKTNEINQAKIILKSIDLAKNIRNPAMVDQNIIEFASIVNEINNNYN